MKNLDLTINDETDCLKIKVKEKNGIFNLYITTPFLIEEIYDDLSYDNRGKYYLITISFGEVFSYLNIYTKEQYRFCYHSNCSQTIVSLIPFQLLNF